MLIEHSKGYTNAMTLSAYVLTISARLKTCQMWKSRIKVRTTGQSVKQPVLPKICAFSTRNVGSQCFAAIVQKLRKFFASDQAPVEVINREKSNRDRNETHVAVDVFTREKV